MVNEAKGRFFRRKDDKYMIYVPKHLAEDSMFPFNVDTSVPVNIGFKAGGKKLTVEKWEEKTDA